MSLSELFQIQHKNPPAPFNPDYDLTCEKWWSLYCKLRREALIKKYKELFPDGEIDGTHFNEVRNSILREFVDRFNAQYVMQAKGELGLT